MIINATLLVQMLNFGITYFLLTRILLYPAARMVLREDAVYDKIRHDIGTLQQRKQEYITFRDQQWRGCVSSLSARKPAGPYCRPYTMYHVSEHEAVSVEMGPELVTQLRDMITRKVHDD